MTLSWGYTPRMSAYLVSSTLVMVIVVRFRYGFFHRERRRDETILRTWMCGITSVPIGYILTWAAEK